MVFTLLHIGQVPHGSFCLHISSRFLQHQDETKVIVHTKICYYEKEGVEMYIYLHIWIERHLKKCDYFFVRAVHL